METIIKNLVDSVETGIGISVDKDGDIIFRIIVDNATDRIVTVDRSEFMDALDFQDQHRIEI